MEILVLILLTLLNAFFAVSEISLISVKKNRLEFLAAQGNSRAKTTLKLLENPERFLSSVQVGITLIGIVSGAYGGATLTDDVERLFDGIEVIRPYAHSLALVIVIGSITYFSIVVGELVPKSVAMNNAEKIALFCAPIIRFISIVAYPFVKLLSVSTNVLLRILGVKEKQEDVLSEEELRVLLRNAGKHGVLEKEEQQVHDNIFSFTDRQARSLMTHYSEVEWIDVNKSVDDIRNFLKITTHSKFPVCDGSIDRLKGYVVAVDFWKNDCSPDFSLLQILKEPVYITETADAFAVLDTFKTKKEYIGFVLDEYGVFKGVITLHDLTEAIVGHLPDSDDPDGDEIVRLPDNSYSLDGNLPVSELNQYFQRKLIEDNSYYTTVAGFLLYKLENLPQPGQKIIQPGMEFEVSSMKGVKIDRVKLSFLKG